ncbi:MAG: hypothetical protein GXO54_04565 [Chloroflexi bacterium]|nr:hypothetical protein [Chloroflexota bacterium]
MDTTVPLTTLGQLLALVLVVLTFSYALGARPLFRVMMHAFIGASAGFLAGLVLRQVFLVGLLRTWRWSLLGFGVVLALLVWIRPLGRWGRRLASLVVAFFVGVVVAVLLVGAVRGSLFPLVRAAWQGPGVGQGWLAVLGTWLGLGITVLVLASFHFGPVPQRWQRTYRSMRALGQVFLGLALAALFVGFYRSALWAFADRIHFLWNVVAAWLTGG